MEDIYFQILNKELIIWIIWMITIFISEAVQEKITHKMKSDSIQCNKEDSQRIRINFFDLIFNIFIIPFLIIIFIIYK